MPPLPSHGPTPTVAQALTQALRAGMARIDAQLLLLHALQHDGHDRAWLLSHDTQDLTPAQNQHWQTLMQRRLAGEPVAYLRGFHDFYGLRLAVDARVLDPRPDTETLVDWALALLPTLPAHPCIVDLGTGSGAVACALARHAPHATVWASDASDAALQVAQHNAHTLGLPIRFAHGDWFSALQAHATPPFFDLIVSNPPYLREHDPHLAALQHEPQQALTSGADGLNALRTIVSQAPLWLRHQGWLLLEHGHDQAGDVQRLLHARGFAQVQGRPDLAGTVRCSGGQWQHAHCG